MKQSVTSRHRPRRDRDQFRHANLAEQTAVRRIDPDTARRRDPDVALRVALHAVRNAGSSSERMPLAKMRPVASVPSAFTSNAQIMQVTVSLT